MLFRSRNIESSLRHEESDSDQSLPKWPEPTSALSQQAITNGKSTFCTSTMKCHAKHHCAERHIAERYVRQFDARPRDNMLSPGTKLIHRCTSTRKSPQVSPKKIQRITPCRCYPPRSLPRYEVPHTPARMTTLGKNQLNAACGIYGHSRVVPRRGEFHPGRDHSRSLPSYSQPTTNQSQYVCMDERGHAHGWGKPAADRKSVV